MKPDKSLHTTINRAMIILCLISLVMVGTMWVIQEYVRAAKGISQLRDEYIAGRKEEIKTEVDRAISYIDYKRSSTELELKRSIKTRVYEAHEIADGIYSHYQGVKSDGEIRELIKEALRSLIFNEGRGYFFIYDMEGTNILLPFTPQLEGENLWDLQDSKGNFTIREAAEIIREKGEGFQNWHWFRPGETEIMSEKIGFNKYFEPYDWWIGTGEYIEDFERDTKKETLEWINNIRFGRDGYIFVYDFDGTILAHFINDNIGSNTLKAIDDPYGAKIVGDLIGISKKEEGDFLTYEGLIRPSTGVRSQKMGYVRSVGDWQWTVGTGVYIDEIDEIIEEKRSSLLRELVRNISTVIIIFFISLVIIGFIIRYITGKTAEQLTVFTRFFKDASVESVKINEEEVPYSEFKLLAKSANQMMDDREKAEREISQLRRYLANVIDSMPSSLIGVDREHRITQWNKEAERISGIPIARAEGNKLEEILPEYAGIHEKISKAINQKKIFQETQNYASEDGKEPRYENIMIFPLESNGSDGAVIRIDNVTKHHEMQNELSHSRRLDAIGQLAGGVAHDFNNMLGGILGGADLLKYQMADDDKGREYIDLIIQSSQRAGELINKLLVFARKGTVESTPISVRETLEEAVAILTHSLDKRINIAMTVQAENTMVIGDSSQIQNVLINLGINAGHAMPDGGELSFLLETIYLDESDCSRNPFDILPGEYVQVLVSDTGVGIEQENLARIYEPFFTTREAGEGNGLGLAAVYATIQQHKGAISVQSEVGRGTVFKILLPATARQKTAQENGDREITGNGLVLVVDDEEILRLTASSILEKLGYKVILAEDGKSGLETFKKEHESIDLVILDMIMPRMNGKDCFHAMKEISPDMKIIMTSGFSREEDIISLKKQGLQGFLKKPYTSTELSRVIAAAKG